MSFKTEAFVLQARVWYKADKIYYLFTPQEGVIKTVLKSAAKPGNKLSGHLLPFSKLTTMIGRGRMDHMAGVKTLVDYKNLRKDLRSLSLASSVAELLLREESSGNKQIEFELLGEIFSFLDDDTVGEDVKMLLVRIFLWKYLSLSGWQPELDNCLLCNKEINGQAGKYIAGRGIICREHESMNSVLITRELVEFLKFIIKADWSKLTDISLSQSLNREWLRLSKIYYQSVYERPSQSLKLFSYG